jgi:dipeptidyl-peptidase-4
MFQYSGPGSQQVMNTWSSSNDYWFMMLTQQGYIVACVDGRGTGYIKVPISKVTQLELGKYEVEDQIDAAKVIGTILMLIKRELVFLDGHMVVLWLLIVS